MSKILDTALQLRYGLRNTLEESIGAYRANVGTRAALAQKLLCYDQVIIPTQDLAIFPVLVDWLGVTVYRELLSSGALTFLKRRYQLIYAGGGTGLTYMLAQVSHKDPALSRALWTNAAEALEIQAATFLPAFGKAERNRLVDETIEHVVDEIELRKATPATFKWLEDPFEVVERDILATPDLLRTVSRGGKMPDLRNLPGLSAKTVKLPDPFLEPKDPAGVVLATALLNEDLSFGTAMAASDIEVLPFGTKLVSTKLSQGAASADIQNEVFERIVDLEGIPDLRTALLDGHVTLPEVARLRLTDAGLAFRKWYDHAHTSTPDPYDDYLEHFRRESRTANLSSLVVRFAVFAALGAISLPLALSDPLLRHFLGVHSPRLLLRRLGSLTGPGGATQTATTSRRSRRKR